MRAKTEKTGPAIVPATVQWQDNGPPLSVNYDDIYFSRAGGAKESEHVFTAGNQLAERFRALCPGGVFTIAETGFGCGLNFLVAWETWEKYAPKDATLHFISVENSPLRSTDLARSHWRWPQFAEKAMALQNQYPALVSGVHRCTLATQSHKTDRLSRNKIEAPIDHKDLTSRKPGNQKQPINLTLFFGDAADWLETTRFYANAWFLDGFSPNKNPDIWSAPVFRGIHRHSLPGTTLATYTVAGGIRQGLTEQGFSVRKTPGYGLKRYMTRGVYLPVVQAASRSSNAAFAVTPTQNSGATHSPRVQPASGPKNTSKKVLIVGSGLAGSLLARNLACRGFQVKVLEASPRTGAGASGNPQGALYVKLAVDLNPHTRYHLASYLFALKTYSRWLAPEWQLWNSTGVLQLSQTAREADRQTKFLNRTSYPDAIVYPVNKAVAEQLTGVELASGGLFFPQGGWCQPARICHALLQHSLITQHTNAAVISQHEASGKVSLITSDRMQYDADYVIYCTGQLPIVKGLESESGLNVRVKSIKGQISQFTLPAGHNFPLQTVICGEGYAMPSLAGTGQQAGNKQPVVVTGSTFHPMANDSQASHQDDLENLRKLGAISPSFREIAETCATNHAITGRASTRAALTDYFPVIGRVQPQTYYNLGYGSKGLALAPLAGEIIADMICETPLPLEDELINRLSPHRFAGKN